MWNLLTFHQVLCSHSVTMENYRMVLSILLTSSLMYDIPVLAFPRIAPILVIASIHHFEDPVRYMLQSFANSFNCLSIIPDKIPFNSSWPSSLPLRRSTFTLLSWVSSGCRKQLSTILASLSCIRIQHLHIMWKSSIVAVVLKSNNCDIL